MDPKHKKALNRCSQVLMQDLDPTPEMTLSLSCAGVLTENQTDTINKIPNRGSKVATLLQILPKRGPNAFHFFMKEISKDYYWLVQELNKELDNLSSIPVNPNKVLVELMKSQLLPMIYPSNHFVDMCNEYADFETIADKLSELLTKLHQKCCSELDVPVKQKSTPLPWLIRNKLSSIPQVQDSTDKGELKDLQKQHKKLQGEKNKLLQLDKNKDDKVKRLTKEAKQHKQDMGKLRKERDQLKKEIRELKMEITNMKAENLHVCGQGLEIH